MRVVSVHVHTHACNHTRAQHTHSPFPGLFCVKRAQRQPWGHSGEVARAGRPAPPPKQLRPQATASRGQGDAGQEPVRQCQAAPWGMTPGVWLGGVGRPRTGHECCPPPPRQGPAPGSHPTAAETRATHTAGGSPPPRHRLPGPAWAPPLRSGLSRALPRPQRIQHTLPTLSRSCGPSAVSPPRGSPLLTCGRTRLKPTKRGGKRQRLL